MPATPAADEPKPSDRDLAWRVLRVAGIDLDRLPVDAREHFRIARERARETPAEFPADPRAAWTVHSIRNLHRFFGGRCVSCANWTPGANGAGTCAEVSAAIGFKTPGATDAVFGCTRYAEIPTAEQATLEARTELAMGLGLLMPYADE